MEEKSADSKSGKPKRRRRPWRCSGCKTRRKQCPRNCVQMYTMNSKKDFETFSDGLRNCTWMEHVFWCSYFSVGWSWMIINENHIFLDTANHQGFTIDTEKKVQERKMITQNNPRFSCLFFGRNKKNWVVQMDLDLVIIARWGSMKYLWSSSSRFQVERVLQIEAWKYLFRLERDKGTNRDIDNPRICTNKNRNVSQIVFVFLYLLCLFPRIVAPAVFPRHIIHQLVVTFVAT